MAAALLRSTVTAAMMSYKLGSVLPLEEDSLHEFKGHRNLAVEELPRWAFIPGTNRRSRTPVSRSCSAAVLN